MAAPPQGFKTRVHRPPEAQDMRGIGLPMRVLDPAARVTLRREGVAVRNLGRAPCRPARPFRAVARVPQNDAGREVVRRS